MSQLSGALAISKLFYRPVTTALDATCGNGHDTLYLAELAEQVYAFDIQPQAIRATAERLAGRTNVRLIEDSFVHFQKYVTQAIDLIVFNLGYLPGSDKTVVTQAADLALALQAMSQQLSLGGRIIIVCYPGHPAGQAESDWLKQSLPKLDNSRFRSFSLSHLNGINQPPELYIIERYAR